MTCAPLALNSRPKARPRLYINPRSQLAATVMPEGKMLTRWARLIALGPSRRQRPGKPIRSMGLILPMQPVPTSSSVPVIMVTFSVRFKCKTKSTAFAVAESHSAKALAVIVQRVSLSAEPSIEGMYSSGWAPSKIVEASPKGRVPKSRSKISRGSIVEVRKEHPSISKDRRC